jgi:hypothetical protein
MQTIFRFAVFMVFLSTSFLNASCSSGDTSEATSEDTVIEGLSWNTNGGGDLHFGIVKNGKDYQINVTRYNFMTLDETITLDSNTENIYGLVNDIFNERHDLNNDTFSPSGETGSFTSITLIYSNDNKVTIKNINSESILLFLRLFVEVNLEGKVENPDPYKFDQTPTNEATEFELMALCVSGELYPPQDLTNVLHDDITGIRSLVFDKEYFSEPLPQTDILFSPPWKPGEIGISFDDETQGIVVSGEYTAWDQLNATYHAEKVNIDILFRVFVKIEFNEKAVHPKRIAEEYNDLAGVEFACASRIIGDFSNIYPYIPGYQDARIRGEGLGDKTRYYLFRKGDGDCPSGCILNDYWLFSVDADSIKYMGYYNPDNFPEKPYWWDIAQKAINLYRTY